MYYLIGLYGQTNHERPRNVLWNSKVSKHSERTDLCLSDDGQLKSRVSSRGQSALVLALALMLVLLLSFTTITSEQYRMTPDETMRSVEVARIARVERCTSTSGWLLYYLSIACIRLVSPRS